MKPTEQQLSALKNIVSKFNGKFKQVKDSIYVSVRTKDGELISAGLSYVISKNKQTYFFIDSVTVHQTETLEDAIETALHLIEIHNA